MSLALLMVVMLAASDRVAVVLPQETAVPFTQLRLGDVATLEGGDPIARDRLASVDLGRGPRLGYPRVISKTGLATYLRTLGIEAEEYELRGADACRVSLRTRVVTKDEILSAARQFLERDLGREGERIELRFDHSLADIRVPHGSGSYELAVEGAEVTTAASTARVRVSVLVDDAVLDSVPLSFEVHRYAPVVVADAPVARDADLAAAALIVREDEITRLRGTPARSLGELAGRKARRAISRGEMLFLEDTFVPPVVKRGELVTVLYRKAGLSVEARGIARGEGAAGDVVTILNVDSQKALRCRVEGPGVVSVLH
ncbi:MAG: flagellar basal body P-ring formation chaperone FlgA [Planctomycetota bacterium]